MGNCCRGILDPQITHKEKVVLAQLPQDLIAQVLILLPVKSLMRFKCVSKSFCTTIDSQHFIESHLTRSAEDRSNLYLIFPYCDRISTNYDLARLPVLRSKICRDVHGYCNGVFLLSMNKSQPALWNPSTHQLRILPCLPGHADGHKIYKIHMDLGYNCYQDDYKIVLIQQLMFNSISDYQVWIFGLRSTSWRRVCPDFFAKFKRSLCYFSLFGYFSHGGLQWLLVEYTHDFTRGTTEKFVVAFDLEKQTFSIVTQPSDQSVKRTIQNLNVLDGCLCINFRDHAIKGVQLFVRKKDAAEFTWSLLYSVTINQFPPFLEAHDFFDLRVLGYSNERDKVMLDLGLEYVVSYDLQEKCFQQTEITIPKKELGHRTRSFVQSLVSLHATRS